MLTIDEFRAYVRSDALSQTDIEDLSCEMYEVLSASTALATVEGSDDPIQESTARGLEAYRLTERIEEDASKRPAKSQLAVTDYDLFRTPRDKIERVAARLAEPMSEQDRVNNAASLRDALKEL